jgi:hypothetical protein
VLFLQEAEVVEEEVVVEKHQLKAQDQMFLKAGLFLPSHCLNQ